MQGVTLSWAAKVCGGELVNAPQNRSVSGFCIDSRKVAAGDLFVALQGERADGHAFIPAATAAGAAASLCRRVPAEAPAIRVRDPRRALGDIAAAYRRRFKSLLVTAVTGSSGKTSTKEMLARVLATKHTVLHNIGNLNNDLGLPLTLGRLGSEHTAAVLEMGMSAAGEIRRLAEIGGPKVGVITNIGEAHLGHFRSRAALARAKAELLDGLVPGGTAVINADDPYLARIKPKRKLTFGVSGQADVRVVSVGVRLSGTHVILECNGRRAEIRMRVLGAHQAWNAAAAVAAGLAAGITFDAACQALDGHASQAAMRSQLLRLGPHRLLHDAYNSNPQSAAAALALLAELPCRGRRFFVAGSMLELGAVTQEAHCRLGHEAAISGVAGLITVGHAARETARVAAEAGVKQVESFETAAGAAEVLHRWLSTAGDLILIKGSRGIGLEEVVDELKERFRTRRSRVKGKC